MAINPYTELGFDRSAKLASFVTLVTLSDFAGFLSATRTGYEPLGFPYRLYPIGLLIFAVFAIVAPKGSFNFKSRWTPPEISDRVGEREREREREKERDRERESE
eukprot:2955743-Rhodomonas_salina.1